MSPAGPDPERVARALVDYANELHHAPPNRLPELVERTCRLLGGEDADIRLINLAQQHLVSLGSHTNPLDVEGTLAGRAYRTGETTLQTDGPRLRLWIPLLDSSERMGVLGVTVASDEDELSTGAGEMWSALGCLVGQAIMSMAGYGDDIALTRGMSNTTLAAEMRWGQLPPLTYWTPEVTVSGILEPAYEIAGDTFDYAVGGTTVQVAVLDAMGHGLEASRMANMAVVAYRHARRHGRSIHDMLSDIDEVISTEYGNHRFVTGQLATLDIHDGTLQIVNAGHPLPLHFRAGRYIGPVECSPSRPLGLGQVETHVTETSLEPGDAVLFFTDGVTESRHPTGEELGEEWLADLMSRQLRSGLSSPEALRLVVRALYDRAGPALHDDATMVLIRWAGSAEQQ